MPFMCSVSRNNKLLWDIIDSRSYYLHSFIRKWKLLPSSMCMYGSTKTRNPQSAIWNPETEMESRKRKRKGNTESAKENKKYISNDNKINKQIKKRHK